jgi:benzoylformate decarboxylase
MSRPGRTALLEQLVADGFAYMFGNPGTVEEGFLDALWNYKDRIKYILTLQESVAVLMADGYARASRRPGLVQIHSTPGLGNAIGALYQAYRGHSPLVVIGGDAGVKYAAMDAQMAGDLVGMARPVTKWSAMVTHPASLLRMVRRAVKIAMTPPQGPVYLCLPLDVLDAEVVDAAVKTVIPSTRVMPEQSLIDQAASLLAAAKTPMIYVGDGVAFSGAEAELCQVAEKLGAEVWGVDVGELLMPHDHPLWQGMTGHMFGYQSVETTRRGDVNLVCGTYMLPEVFPELGNVFREDAKTIHVDLNAYEIAKNHPVDLGLVCDPKLSLSAIAAALDRMMNNDQRAAAQNRIAHCRDRMATRRSAEKEVDRERGDAMPLTFARFMEELGTELPEDAVIFDEALTNSPAVTRYAPRTKPGQYFLTRGGSLGVGIPGAIGAKLAQPDKQVIGIAGDGAAMYVIQALWTAARHSVDAKFVICNNGSYRLLQLNLAAYWRERGMAPGPYPLSFDLSEPPLGFVEMAGGQSVRAIRVERPEQIRPAIDEMLRSNRPILVDVVIEGDVRPDLVGVVCGQ